MVERNELAKKVVERNLVNVPQESSQETFNQVSIIRGLSIENDLMKIDLRLRGYTFEAYKGTWVQTRKPILNEMGRGNLLTTLQSIGDIANFSNYNEKEISKLASLFFEQNYPTYLIYSKEFELSPKDFNIVKTILQFWTLSILKNAKGAGHRNVVRGTLSESVLAKALGSGEEDKKKKGVFGFLKRGGNKNG